MRLVRLALTAVPRRVRASGRHRGSALLFVGDPERAGGAGVAAELAPHELACARKRMGRRRQTKKRTNTSGQTNAGASQGALQANKQTRRRTYWKPDEPQEKQTTKQRRKQPTKTAPKHARPHGGAHTCKITRTQAHAHAKTDGRTLAHKPWVLGTESTPLRLRRTGHVGRGG